MTKVKVLKKVGFKFMLKKRLRFSQERMSLGSLFQSSGAETVNNSVSTCLAQINM